VTHIDTPTSEQSERAASNEELREIPAETRRANQGWRPIGVPTERSEDFGAAVRRLVDLLRPERPLLALIALMAIGTTVLNVLGPRVLGHATDTVIKGVVTKEGIDFTKLHHILFQAAALYIGAAALGIGIAYTLAGVVQRLMFRLRAQAEAKLNALPLSYVDRQARGDLLSRVTNDLDNVAQSLQQTMSQMLTSVLLLVGVAVMMFTISPVLALVALTTVPVSLWAMRTIGAKARPRFIGQWRSTGELNAQIEETFTGHSIVKAFGRQHEIEERFRETNDSLYEASFGAQFMSSLMQPATMFLTNIQYVLVAVVGAFRVAAGAITVGDVQGFIP
jgi:ATP-binding cassette subfamily B protein